ncbi:fungal-specific transcription factor domain-containing protein [Penicillium angulare]|uniref:fungal-specific transcription factor domain-containing protein n=1 Tax=Penicillium angulare TaxID=116970 RepID=UPI002541BB6B|nr:fungal-specific transcription factor domain-containing protein [Penicillium angulare]KAJ5291877.1 fungal-specific transcription factor domain-containing protein [Penicillium angulare]
MRSTDAACLTCRQKSRRCDRARPMCKRCISRGLQCGGYPDKFRFCGIATRGKWRNQNVPVDQVATSPTTQVQNASNDTSPAPSTRDEYPTSPDNSTPSDEQEIKRVLASAETGMLITHYDRVICPHQIALRVESKNPYRVYVLSLAYEQIGLLHAVLALSACHFGHLNSNKHFHEAVAVDYRLKAIAELGVAIRKVSSGDFNDSDRDGVFATIQILLLHDICESGVSLHGAHISGAMSICSQLKLDQRLTVSDERTVFFLGNLAWLDIIRSFSAPERLCFPQKLREKLLSLCDLRFESVNGCPRELVLVIGNVLEHTKAHSTGRISTEVFQNVLKGSIQKFYLWDSSRCFFPDANSLWLSVAEAFRHTCILSTRRLLDDTESAFTPHIQESVNQILDSISNIPASSPLIELLVLPLFIAGADCLSQHSRHYIMLRYAEIKARSEMGIYAPQDILEKVWQARAQQSNHDRNNVPWRPFRGLSQVDLENGRNNMLEQFFVFQQEEPDKSNDIRIASMTARKRFAGNDSTHLSILAVLYYHTLGNLDANLKEQLVGDTITLNKSQNSAWNCL